MLRSQSYARRLEGEGAVSSLNVVNISANGGSSRTHFRRSLPYAATKDPKDQIDLHFTSLSNLKEDYVSTIPKILIL